MDLIENTASSSSSIVACALVAGTKSLSIRCLAMDLEYITSHCLATGREVLTESLPSNDRENIQTERIR
jgi:hypothetical protein